MAKKKILTLGFSLYGDDVEYCEFSSETSLLDWDIILIQPDISDFMYRGNDYFQGKKIFRIMTLLISNLEQSIGKEK